MNRWRIAFYLCLALSTTIFYECVNHVCGVETTNGATITVSLNAIEVKTLTPSNVFLSNNSYVPLAESGLLQYSSLSKSGFVTFNDLDSGTYTVLVTNLSNDSSVMLYNISVGNDSLPVIDTVYLDKGGVITGTVAAVKDTATRVIVYLAETSYYTVVLPGSTYTIKNVPPGSHRLRIATLHESAGEQKPTVITDRNETVVTIKPGERVTVDR